MVDINMKAVNELFGNLFRDHNQKMREREQELAKADPMKYKLSRTFPPNTSIHYHYYDGGRDKWKRRILFCYAINRNVAGFYLTWREVIGPKVTKRDHWSSRRKRKDAKAMAYKRYQDFKSR